MQNRLVWIAAVVLVSGSVSVANATALKTQRAQLSYAYGYKIADSLSRQGVKVDKKVFLEAISDGLVGRKPRITEAQMDDAIRRFEREHADAGASASIKAGNAFRAKYRKKKGVKTLPDGMLYRILRKGTGSRPAPADTVTVNYSGRLVNGQVFDSSYSRGEPATFPVRGVIKGWQEILPMMRTGAKWEVVIPPQLAYGANGFPPKIPPQATLVFQIELLSIKSQ